MCLWVPMTHVLIHAIIDDLRGINDKVFRFDQMTGEKWWNKAPVWVMIARIGLPVIYMVVALTIIMPGVLNKMAEVSNDGI